MTTILQLCEMQRYLDDKIIREKQIRMTPSDRLANTQVALMVELAEFANEGRWFKVWSEDQKPRNYGWEGLGGVSFKETNPLLEEFVDGIHFFLSIANQSDIRGALEFNELVLSDRYKQGDREKINASFLNLHYELSRFNITKSKVAFAGAWMNFMTIGLSGCGFTWRQITEAYIEKNKTNHDRQAEGY